MAFTQLTPILMVKNINETVSYYTDVLGFDFTLAVLEEGMDVVTAKGDPRPKVFAMLAKDNTKLMFQSESSFKEDFPDCILNSNGDTLTLYFEVDDVSQMVADLEGKANIIKPVNDTFYGKRELTIRDCNGYIVTFAQDIGCISNE